MTRWLITLLVLAHLLINLLHGRAHAELGVGLNNWQQIFVIAVILIAPLIAAVLVWTRLDRFGLLLLILSMLGSLLFGVYHHYIAISNDHVSHLPPGAAQGMFRTTALLLVLSEVLGVLVGVLGLRTNAIVLAHEKHRVTEKSTQS